MSWPFSWVEDTLKSHLIQQWPEMRDSIAWKNLTFSPQGRTLWLKVINSPISETPITLGVGGENELRGYLQIGVYSPVNVGTVDSGDALWRLRAMYTPSSRLPAPEGCLLRLESTGFSSGGQTSVADFTRGGTEDEWDANYITVYWLAREPR